MGIEASCGLPPAGSIDAHDAQEPISHRRGGGRLLSADRQRPLTMSGCTVSDDPNRSRHMQVGDLDSMRHDRLDPFTKDVQPDLNLPPLFMGCGAAASACKAPAARAPEGYLADTLDGMIVVDSKDGPVWREDRRAQPMHISNLHFDWSRTPSQCGEEVGQRLGQRELAVPELSLGGNQEIGPAASAFFAGVCRGVGDSNYMPALTKIFMRECALTPESGRPIGLFLKRCPALAELNFSMNEGLGVDDGGSATNFFDGLLMGLGEGQLNGLARLGLMQVGLCAACGEPLGRFLAEYGTRLTELDLSRNSPLGATVSHDGESQASGAFFSGFARGLGAAAPAGLEDSQGALPRLTTCDISKCSLGPESGEPIGRMLAGCPALSVLKLSMNTELGGARGFFFMGLATGLGGTKLHRLNKVALPNSGMVADSGEGFGRFLAQCPDVSDVDLFNNRALGGESGAFFDGVIRGLEEELPESQGTHSRLAKIDLSVCGVGAEDGEALGRLVKKLPNLVEIQGVRATEGVAETMRRGMQDAERYQQLFGRS